MRAALKTLLKQTQSTDRQPRELEMMASTMKQKFFRDLQKMAGQFKDQLFHNLDYFFELMIIAVNKMVERVNKDNLSLRDEKTLLVHFLNSDFSKFLDLVQQAYKTQKVNSFEQPIDSLWKSLVVYKPYAYLNSIIKDSDDEDYK